uniref:Cadherin domain-containing protein n=1 Tax=Hucho hucho TaxID=62062 RepID=A0A4W5L3J8_9TELE
MPVIVFLIVDDFCGQFESIESLSPCSRTFGGRRFISLPHFFSILMTSYCCFAIQVTNAFVTIHVRDYNDNQPTMTIIFLSEDGSPRISEGAQPGQYVARISVTDPDYGEYANVNVSLEGGDGKFALTTKDSIIYLICVDQVLDREERDTYELRVMATDAGTPPLRAESSFTIQVTDVNDNPPLFDQQAYKQTIPEVVYPGSFVLQVTARDKDQGPNGDIRYSLLKDKKSHSDWFSIDPVTGIITTAMALDYESEPAPSVTVVATDNGRPPMSSTARVAVVLQDVNDNEPVFSSNFYNVTIKENTAVGTCFLEVGIALSVCLSVCLFTLCLSLLCCCSSCG